MWVCEPCGCSGVRWDYMLSAGQAMRAGVGRANTVKECCMLLIEHVYEALWRSDVAAGCSDLYHPSRSVCVSV